MTHSELAVATPPSKALARPQTSLRPVTKDPGSALEVEGVRYDVWLVFSKLHQRGPAKTDRTWRQEASQLESDMSSAEQDVPVNALREDGLERLGARALDHIHKSSGRGESSEWKEDKRFSLWIRGRPGLC